MLINIISIDYETSMALLLTNSISNIINTNILFQNIIAVYMYVMYSICIALHQLNAIKHNLEKSRTIKKMACHAGC